MDINVGDRIIYTFPNPIIKNKTYVIGRVESIDDFYINIRTDNNIKLKITFKNFDYIKPLKRVKREVIIKNQAVI